MDRADLGDLMVFAAVARLRSFRQAGEDLGVSASAVSHALRGLEARLGVRLVHRTTRSVAPTEAGALLLAGLEPAFEGIGDALSRVDRFRAEPRGTVRLTVPRAAAPFLLGSLLAGFVEAHPEVKVEVCADDALADMVGDGFDAGVRFGESIAGDMLSVPLGPPQRLVVVGARDYLAAVEDPVRPEDLRGHRCIRYQFPSGRTYRWEFQKDGVATEVAVQGPLAMDDQGLMLGAAAAGAGLAYVFEANARPFLTDGRLRTVLDDWCPAYPGFRLYWISRRHVPPALRAFIDFVKGTQAPPQ